MKEEFRSFNFRPDTLEKIARAEQILREYRAQGYRMSARQIYYQFIARGWLPENSQRQYKSLCNALKNARYAGEIDWDDIEDRVRKVQGGGDYGTADDVNQIL
jgi:hypothetical protein